MKRLLCLSIFILLLITPINAQEDTSWYRIAVQTSDRFAFYAVDNIGNYSLIRDFGTQFGVFAFNIGEWTIPTTSDIVPSPDGRFIALVAAKSERIALFIYDLKEDRLKETPIEGYASLVWSPDNSAIALIPAERFALFPPALLNLSVYELSTDTLEVLTSAREPVFWTQDGLSLLYNNSFDWFKIDKTSQNIIRLTNLYEQIPANLAHTAYSSIGCATQLGEWSKTSSRLYYVLTCVNDDERRQNLIYSLSADGDNRLELDVLAVFPNDYDHAITNLITLNSGVYAAITGRPLIDDVYHTAWRVIRITHPDETEIVYEMLFPPPMSRRLTGFDVSPTGERFILSGITYDNNEIGSYMAVINQSGVMPAQAYEFEQTFCDLDWLDAQHLIMTEYPERDCGFFERTGEQFQLDTETGSLQRLNTPPGSFFIIDTIIPGTPLANASS